MPDGTQDIVQRYWDDLPREMRVELLHGGKNSQQILERAATELGLEFEVNHNESGHVRKEDIAQFTVAVMEKYGDA